MVDVHVHVYTVTYMYVHVHVQCLYMSMQVVTFYIAARIAVEYVHVDGYVLHIYPHVIHVQG